MQDTESPLVGYFCKLSNPYLSTLSPTGSVISSLHCKMLTNQLHEVGDTTTKVTSGPGCLTITCWSEKDDLKLMVENISHAFADPRVWADNKRVVFEDVKHSWLQSLKAPGNPKTIAREGVKELIQEKYWSDIQIIDTLQWLEFEEARRLVQTKLKHCSVTTFVYGNVKRKWALELDLSVKEKLSVAVNSERTLPERTVDYGSLRKPRIYQCVLSEKMDNCIVNAYPLFPTSSKGSAKAQLCIDMMRNHLLSTASSGDKIQLELQNVLGLLVYCVAIESRSAPEKMNSRVETFHREWLRTLNVMAASTFYERVQRTVTNFSKPLDDIADRFWSEILNEQYAFSSVKNMAEEVSKLELAEVLQFYKDYIHPEGSKRAKLGTWVYANGVRPVNSLKGENVFVCRQNIERLKDSLPLNPSYLQSSIEAHISDENSSKL